MPLVSSKTFSKNMAKVFGLQQHVNYSTLIITTDIACRTTSVQQHAVGNKIFVCCTEGLAQKGKIKYFLDIWEISALTIVGRQSFFRGPFKTGSTVSALCFNCW